MSITRRVAAAIDPELPFALAQSGRANCSKQTSTHSAEHDPKADLRPTNLDIQLPPIETLNAGTRLAVRGGFWIDDIHTLSSI